MNRRDVPQLINDTATRQDADDSDVPVARPGPITRFYHWLLDEIAPPPSEPFDDWADRQW